MTPRGPGRLVDWLRVLPAGLAAGAAAFAVDRAAAGWMLTYSLRLEAVQVEAYLLAGLALAALVAGVRRLFGAASLGIAGLGARAFALVWAPAVVERVIWAAGARQPFLEIGLGAIALAVVGCGLWIAAKLGNDRPALGWVVAGITLSLALAVHRDVSASDLSRRALGLDLVLAAAAVLTLAAASLARRRLRLGAIAALVGLIAWGVLAWETRAPGLPRSSGASAGTTERSASDLILIVIDTLRADVFQEILATTPEGQAFRDRLRDAAFFDRAVAVAPWTAPSVASILTGVYPSEHGFGRSLPGARALLAPLPRGIPTLAEILRRRGYRTFASVANPLLYPSTQIGRGFDRYEVLQSSTTKLPLLTVLNRWKVLDGHAYQTADLVRRRAEGEIGALKASRPFFLWLHFMDPHQPYLPHRGLSGGPGRDTVAARYRGEVRFVLAQLTRLVDRLRAEHLWQDSAVVIVADHGEMFRSDHHDGGVLGRDGRPKLTGHGHALYEELVHVPLVIRPPGGLPHAARSDRLVSQVDLMATMLDLVGAAAPAAGNDAVDLAPWLREGGEATPRSARSSALSGFCHFGHGQRALTWDRFQVIDFGRSRVELYDVAADPQERNDLAQRDPERLQEGQRRLDERWAELRHLRGAEAPADVVVDEATRRQLEALGY